MTELRWPTYPDRGIELVEAVPDPEGRGSMRVRDAQGKTYLDAVGGIGCTPLGHAHPRWVEAVATQAGRLSSAANSYATGPARELARRLTEAFPLGAQGSRVFFCNTGTEATEAAIKLALRATGRDMVVAFEGAFHGRTLGAIGLTANPKYRDPYVDCVGEEPRGRFLRAQVLRLPFGDPDALREAFAEYGQRIAMVAIEPIEGEAGVFPHEADFLGTVRSLCDEHGALLGADEIQTGTGRTGHWSAWETLTGGAHRPDILWLAKALGGGFPIGACLCRTELATSMARGSHGTTFGGNPLASAAGLATLDIIEDEKLMDLAALQRGMLDEIAAARPISAVRGIRGRGAMLAIQVGECGEDLAAPLGAKLAQRGVLVTTPGGHSVRLLLPYRAGKEELSEIWEALGDALATS